MALTEIAETNRPAHVELAPGVYYFSRTPAAKTNVDFADGFSGRPFAGKLAHADELVDPLRGGETRPALKPSARLDAYWAGQRLRARLTRGELVVREGDHFLVPDLEQNVPCSCGVAARLPEHRPDDRLPLNYL